jgi:hypothetical protein
MYKSLKANSDYLKRIVQNELYLREWTSNRNKASLTAGYIEDEDFWEDSQILIDLIKQVCVIKVIV